MKHSVIRYSLANLFVEKKKVELTNISQHHLRYVKELYD